MRNDWHKRYEAAQEEACASRVAWNEAEQVMARANARRHNAERRLDAVLREGLDQFEESWQFPTFYNQETKNAQQ